MDCLALALQPVHGPDLLLQTKTWFPPARAKAACQAFRETRQADTALKQHRDTSSHQVMMLDRLGDDPLAAASGQVVVGSDRRYRVVYRLVNTIYVLVITSADSDDEDFSTSNIFQCTTAVNQAVSVLVMAGKGVDVTPEKVFRKYTEVYLAFYHILHGVGPFRLAALLTAVHGDGAALLSPLPSTAMSASERHQRGAATWTSVRSSSVQRLATVEVLQKTNFELPEEALSLGDKAMATFAPPPTQLVFDKPKKKQPAAGSGAAGTPAKGALVPGADPLADPFLASDSLLGGSLLAQQQQQPASAGGEQVADPAALLLAELEAPSGGGAADPFGGEDLDATAVFGLDEDDPALGGVVAAKEGGGGGGDDAWGSAFGGSALLGGDSDAWGGGLDASEFGVEGVDAFGDELGLGGDVGGAMGGAAATAGPGLELEAALGMLPGGLPTTPAAAVVAAPAAAAAEPDLPKLPVFRFEERISVEFAGANVSRVRLQGTLFLGYRATPKKQQALVAPAAAGEAPSPPPASDPTREFSFRLDGSAGIKRAVVRSSLANSLGRGYFHIKLPTAEEEEAAESERKAQALHQQQQQRQQGQQMDGDGEREANGEAGGVGEGEGGGVDLLDYNEGDRSEALGGTTSSGQDGSSLLDHEGALGALDGGFGGMMGEETEEDPAAVMRRKGWREVPLIKYRLQPRFTPIPLRVRLLRRRTEENLSFMVQYVANPYLQSPLVDATFVLCMPYSPASLRLSPAAELDPWKKELRWRVSSIKPDDPPQRLRAQIPVIPETVLRPHDEDEEELTPEEKEAEEARLAKELASFNLKVTFRSFGGTLSGISALEAVVSTTQPFTVDERSFFRTDAYLCS